LKKEERRRKKKEERRRVFFILSLIFERRFYTINIELSRKIGKPKIKEVSGAFRQEFEGVGKMFLKRGGGETQKLEKNCPVSRKIQRISSFSSFPFSPEHHLHPR